MKKLISFGGIFLVMGFLIPPTKQSDCQLPSTWTGTWFHKDYRTERLIKVDRVSINFVDAENAEFLGTCKNRSGEVFIFENLSNQCTKCVYITELDSNVLRYKETVDCLSETDLSALQHSKVEDVCIPLMPPETCDIIRDPFVAVPCPFSNQPFLFSYGKDDVKTEAICSSPNSHTESCYDHTQLVFDYVACRDMSYEAKVEQIQCVGTWSESGHSYLVATILKHSSGSGILVNGKFRCFLYNQITDSKVRGNPVIGYNVTISETSSCSGKHGDGEFYLTLYTGDKDQDQGQSPSCSFPPWFNSGSKSWSSLDHQLLINWTGKSDELTFSKGHTQGKFSCRQKIETDEDVTILGREVVGCTGRDICLKFSKKTESISNLVFFYKMDHLTQSEFTSICFDVVENDTEIYTGVPSLLKKKEVVLIESKVFPNPVPCPIEGHFKLVQFTENGSFLSRHKMCKAPNPLGRQPVALLAEGSSAKFMNNEKHCRTGSQVAQCLGSWSEGNRTYFVASFENDGSYPDTPKGPINYCFTYQNDTNPRNVLFHARSTEHCPSPGSLDLNAFSFWMQDMDFDDESTTNNVLQLASVSLQLNPGNLFLTTISASVIVKHFSIV